MNTSSTLNAVSKTTEGDDSEAIINAVESKTSQVFLLWK